VKVHHVAVVVSDLARAEAFYGGLLGLPVIARHGERATWLDAGGTILMLERAAATGGRADDVPGWHCVALGIEAAAHAEWRARLGAANAFARESDYTVYARDPDGNLVGLSHYPAPCPR
jgi:catechol 2,3-dioxygenase-like lactoylglutathione lyase family enzyme